jgi:aspartate aminotransferase-like enzyme
VSGPELGPVGADEYAATASLFARLLHTTRDLLLLQGEAAFALEAAARGLGAPGRRILNLVTGPYGAAMGDWFRQTGAEAVDLAVPFDRAIHAGEVAEALAQADYDVVSVVHAEAATGAVNPLAEIAALAHEADALLVVDAVASLGAEPLVIDGWNLDLVVLSTQKALAGPTGACAAVLSERAWEAIESNPIAPRRSVLSLLDWRELWLGSGRRTLPVIPHHLETRALDAALSEASAEGLASVVERHVAARDASRRGLRALGVEPWVALDADAAAVVTSVRVPAGLTPSEILAAPGRPRFHSILEPAPRSLSEQALRIAHVGRRARLEDVSGALIDLALGLQACGVEVELGGTLAAALAPAAP